MAAVSVREFSYNPSGMFARVEKGETIEVTRHGRVIAVLVPSAGPFAEYAHLVAKGAIKLAPKTTSDLDEMTRVEIPSDIDPLQELFALRELDGDR